MNKRIPWVHIVLFCLTVLSTLYAGALWEGIDILSEPWRFTEGWPFTLALLSILISHEFSHYITSRLHKTKASLPYFIPAPTAIGTFGAIIRMKSPITTRKALIDIGASGPIAGFVISVVTTIIGLNLSEVTRTDEIKGIGFGSSIIYLLLSRLVLGEIPEDHSILLHPVALAGWIGFLVTSLNLIPVGQLDGGHIAYAILGRFHKFVSLIFIGILLILGIFAWYGWFVWAGLLLVVGIKHPPIIFWEDKLTPSRKLITAISALIFILSFIPVPLQTI